LADIGTGDLLNPLNMARFDEILLDKFILGEKDFAKNVGNFYFHR
jgi:hypothetical protein